MQAVNLPAIAGWRWIKMGWELFRQQPSGIFTWTMLISLVLIFSSLIAPIGPVIFIALVPTITYLTLCACRQIHSGKKLLFPEWFTPLKQKPLVGKLLRLGLIYVGICLLAGLISFLPFSPQISQAVTILAEQDDLTPLVKALNMPMMIFGILYLLLAALFWYSPVLIGWHGFSIAKSLFFSAVACWRNKWALILYAVIWAGIFTLIDLFLGVLVGIGLPLTLVAILQVPANMVAGSVLYCSFYPTYITVFTEGRMAREMGPSTPADQS